MQIQPNPELNKYLTLSPYFVDTKKTSDSAWKNFQNKINRMPESLYNFLIDVKTAEFIGSISQKYIQLSVQGPDVARLIRDIVIGDIFIGDMPKAIAERLGVDQTLARDVANQIVSQLFTPVIEDIKKVQNERYPGRLPSVQRPASSEQMQTQPPALPPQVKPAEKHYQGEELPESGGNIIDLRKMSND